MSLFDITLKWWWMLALLPVPFIVRFLFARQGDSNSTEGALNVPFFAQLSLQFGTTSHTEKGASWKWLLLTLSWMFLVLAIARPTLVGEKIPLPVMGRDVMLALDLSGSMRERDLGSKINRLGLVKVTANAFIERRMGDRVGLIFFSERAYLQVPLTFDRKVVRELLNEAKVGLTGQRTAIGDAIAIGLKRLRETFTYNNKNQNKADGGNDKSDNKENIKNKKVINKKNKQEARKYSQVLILLTDGENNAGVTEPKQATEIAKTLGIKIYTIGVGGKSKLVKTPFGMQRVLNNELDESTLKEIAKSTGGRYFRATDAEELENIYEAIDELEPVDRDPKFLRPEVALYYYPALFSLGLGVLLMLFSSLGTFDFRGNKT